MLNVEGDVEGGGQVGLIPGLGDLPAFEDDRGREITRGHGRLGLRGVK